VVSARTRSFVVVAADAGRRLDQVLREHVPELTRRVLNDVFLAAGVTVDGRAAAKGDRARAGSLVEVFLPPEDRALPDPTVVLSVVGEGDGWVVVDKPALVPSAVRDGRDSGSIANALVARYPAMAEFGYHPREAGLVHRLDTETSGLLLAATTEPAFSELVAALRRGHLHKCYLALAIDVIESHGCIQSRLEPSRGARVGVAELVHEPVLDSLLGERDGLRTTEYRVLGRRGRVALLEVRVRAAYRHQIRAHLSAIGSPILGDALYGSATSLPRHALHASRLGYIGGEVVGPFEVESALPEGLEAVWRGC
jgi:23S rRNA pseudouridine1911/1915/1917 synthase